MRGCDRLIKVLDGGGREWAGGYVRGWGGGGGGRGGIDGQGQDTHCNDITKDTKTEKITKKYVLKQGRTNTSKFKIRAHRMMT